MTTAKLSRRRDPLQAHYTRSAAIVAYMVSRLQVTSSDSVWEPCAGEGDLVAGVLEAAPAARIQANEVNPLTAYRLTEALAQCPTATVSLSDALELGLRPDHADGERITRVIANPPYGGWQEPERRQRLKARYPGLYVKDTYAVFLFHAFERLTAGGRLVFIIPDTFLWLHRHEFLRRHLLTNACIEEIALFPSRFFPGIAFGYSGLCILTLRKSLPEPAHEINVMRRFESTSDLHRLAVSGGRRGVFDQLRVPQRQVMANPHGALLLPNEGMGATEHSPQPEILASVADVVTGFYSGDDTRWLRRGCTKVRRASEYQEVNRELIWKSNSGDVPPLEGIKGTRCFVPIIRGGAHAFSKPTLWYVEWSREAVAAYRRKGKNPARFQNSRYYFRQGIAVPMVASTRLTASLTDHRLFDQSIVGVFPRNPALLRYILAFLNSRIATSHLRMINPTANNSANYLKRLPFVHPTPADLGRVNRLVDTILETARLTGHIEEEPRRALERVITRIWQRQ